MKFEVIDVMDLAETLKIKNLIIEERLNPSEPDKVDFGKRVIFYDDTSERYDKDHVAYLVRRW